MVQKLSGFAKFDLDTKITAYQFFNLVHSFCQVENEVEREIVNEEGATEFQIFREKSLDESKYDAVLSLFEKAFRDGQPPFLGDLENETYKHLLLKFKNFVL